MKSALLFLLLVTLTATAQDRDWINRYVESQTCAKLLGRASPEQNEIPERYRGPLLSAYRKYLQNQARLVPKEVRERRLPNLSPRMSIPFAGRHLPVLATLGLGLQGVHYAVQTEEGVQSINECSLPSVAKAYVRFARAGELPVFGGDRCFVRLEFVLGLPETLVTSEFELEELDINETSLAQEIARWAETRFPDTTAHNRGNVVLELTTGRAVQISRLVF